MTPKMFICEVPEKVVEDGDCFWIQGSVVDVEMGESGELEMITLDDGTSSIKISIKDKLKDVNYEGFNEKAVVIYRGLVEELVQKGKYISTVCQLNEGLFKVLHISDSINKSRDSENEWINSIIRSRNFREDEL
ncbi:uncharacterized protein cubi_00957 [Cryptosporidium ubiquitum]|uniref:OB domain-containing protein n=1 Tax=Cryptosporidium ubiquitum TaxID=857276 RepID=A0A1J4MCS1_9CRYT|nr:uncharacterized protein cubi_00957 [Cryptosporidium ubiquitum]OII70812.1 hypothetical protein cubi_00957 [Cryptosporidium ubiquitum]